VDVYLPFNMLILPNVLIASSRASASVCRVRAGIAADASPTLPRIVYSRIVHTEYSVPNGFGVVTEDRAVRRR
jgi:hypothetical protein